MVSVSHRFACPAGCEFTAVKWSVMKMHLTSPELTCRWVMQCFPNQCRALSEKKIDAVKKSVISFGNLAIWKVPTTVALPEESTSGSTVWSADEWRIGDMDVMLSYDHACGVPGPLAACATDEEGTLVQYRTAVCTADSIKAQFSPWRAEVVKSTVFLHQRVAHNIVSPAAEPNGFLWVCVEVRSDAVRRVGGTLDVDDANHVVYWTPPQVECGLCVSEIFSIRGLHGCFERQLSPGVVRAHIGRASGVMTVTAMCYQEKNEELSTLQCVNFSDDQKLVSVECAYESGCGDTSERVVLRILDVVMCAPESSDPTTGLMVMTGSPSFPIKEKPPACQASLHCVRPLTPNSPDSCPNTGTDSVARDSVKDEDGEGERTAAVGECKKMEVMESPHVGACVTEGQSRNTGGMMDESDVNGEPHQDDTTQGQGGEMKAVSNNSTADQAPREEKAKDAADPEAKTARIKPHGGAANGEATAKSKDVSATKSADDTTPKEVSAPKSETETKLTEVNATKREQHVKAKREDEETEQACSASDSVCGSSTCSGWAQRKQRSDAAGKNTSKVWLHTPPPGFGPPASSTTLPALKVIGYPISPAAVGAKNISMSNNGGLSCVELYPPRVSPRVVGNPLSSTKVRVVGKKVIDKGDKGKNAVSISDKHGGKSGGKGKNKWWQEDWTVNGDWGWWQGEWVDSAKQKGKGMTTEEKKAEQQRIAEEKKEAQKKAAEEKKKAQKKAAEEKKAALKKAAEEKKEAQKKTAEEKKQRAKEEAEKKAEERKLRDKVLTWVKYQYIQHWHDAQKAVRWRIVLKKCDLDDALVKAVVAYVDAFVTHKEPDNNLQHIVENFDIAENRVTDEGADSVLTLLNAPNVSWTRLSLYNNALTDRAALRISEALKVMTVAPTELHLSDCKITDVGFLALLDALKANKVFPRVDRNKWPVPLWLQLRRNHISRACIQKCQQERVICDASQRDCCHIHYCRFARLRDKSSPLLHLKNITEQFRGTTETNASVWQ